MNRLRIGIDARFWTLPQPGGFRTYTRSLLQGLAAIDRENEYFLYLQADPGEDWPFPENFHAVAIPDSSPLVGMPWREQGALPRRVQREHIDVFHAPCLTAPLRLHCPSVVTIHDLIWLRSPRLGSGGNALKHWLLDCYYRWIPEQAAQRANEVLTVSGAARDAIVSGMPQIAEKTVVVYEAASSFFCPMNKEEAAQATQARFGVAKPFLLGMGSADPRKNVEGLLRSYALLPEPLRAKYDLAIVWTSARLAGELQALAGELKIAEATHFLSNVSDQDLLHLYNSASAFVFPSRNEGFGLPLLEAMACGAPVVSANNSSLPEIAGDAALLANSEDAPAFALQTEALLCDEILRERMIERGFHRAAEFTWEKCARETLAAYYRAAGGAQ